MTLSPGYRFYSCSGQFWYNKILNCNSMSVRMALNIPKHFITFLSVFILYQLWVWVSRSLCSAHSMQCCWQSTSPQIGASHLSVIEYGGTATGWKPLGVNLLVTMITGRLVYWKCKCRHYCISCTYFHNTRRQKDCLIWCNMIKNNDALFWSQCRREAGWNLW